MLAVVSPVSSAFHRSSKDSPQLSRSSGLDALLSEKVEFVEGSSTGVLAQGDSKYPYINVPNDEESRLPKTPISSRDISSLTNNSASELHASSPESLYIRPLAMTWAMSRKSSVGFINTGNTCFMNSVLQCLLHTSPLQHLLKQHGTAMDRCHLSGSFCMACKLRATMESALGGKYTQAFIPSVMVNNLQRIAKHMRRGRQEDAHEFLRYSVDALQRSCLAGYPPKLDTKLTETSWVHKLFGGRLRSRVTCGSCGYDSDTFDAILDLSLDIQDVTSLKQALSKFVQIDRLRGSNKYKCEKCKSLVNADKQLTIHDPPTCLTVHLKRFSPLGRKITHQIDYNSVLDLQPAMSKGQYGPRYSLYGVISHAGGGPHSGHYYAHVKGPDGSWYDANDDIVSKIPSTAVTSRRSAYMLFYMRMPGETLGAAINLPTVNSNKNLKRKSPDDDEDRGVAVSSLISPSKILISPPILTEHWDNPVSAKLNEKVAKLRAAEAAKVSQSIKTLVSYPSSEGEEDSGMNEGKKSAKSPSGPLPPSSPSSITLPHSSSTVDAQDTPPLRIKRKSPSSDDDGSHSSEAKRRRMNSPSHKQRPSPSSLNGLSGPFRITNNLHEPREGDVNFMPMQHGARKQQIAQVGFKLQKRGLIGSMKRRVSGI